MRVFCRSLVDTSAKKDLVYQLSEEVRSRFDKQSCSFGCDQIHKRHWYESGHTLLCSLSPTSLLNKSAAVGVTKFINVNGMNLVTPCCAQVQQVCGTNLLL
jgi:hypothetical protein